MSNQPLQEEQCGKIVGSNSPRLLEQPGRTPRRLPVTQPKYTPVLPVEKLIPHIDATGDCWEWIGTVSSAGYGVLSVKIDGEWRHRRAHRLVWTALCGPIPGNLPLDHLCRFRRCVNPDHLEPVTNRENCLRGVGLGAVNALKDRCKWGHSEWWITRDGQRACLACSRQRRKNPPSSTAVPPKPCTSCSRLYKPLRRGLCASCDARRVRAARRVLLVAGEAG